MEQLSIKVSTSSDRFSWMLHGTIIVFKLIQFRGIMNPLLEETVPKREHKFATTTSKGVPKTESESEAWMSKDELHSPEITWLFPGATNYNTRR